MSNRSTFTPDPHACLAARPVPAFAISTEVVSVIRDPMALALYVYIRSNLSRKHLRQYESAMAHFAWTVAETDSAYDELKRIGVIS